MPASILYFDAFNGVAGDMILGALLDLGLPLDLLESELGKLKLEPYRLSVERISRQGLSGMDFKVRLQSRQTATSSSVEVAEREHGDGEPSTHADHRHSHEDHHDPGHESSRNYAQIRRMIQESELHPEVREMSGRIFHRLAAAEAKVHGTSIDSVHFHEVGAVDSIVDVVGACIGFHHFGFERFYSSPLALGGGVVTFSHGTWPVPTPATLELTKGVPTVVGGIQSELTTPTGAAIVTSLVEGWESPPCFQVQKSGLGAGDREIAGIPNMLRLLAGNAGHPSTAALQERILEGIHIEEIVLLEANIDDMDAEMFGHFLQRALDAGALDVFYTPVQMKKNRPGLVLSMLTHPRDQHRMAELIFKETTTLGIRIQPIERWALEREVKEVETEFGPVRVKLGRLAGQVINCAPEFEDLQRIAEREKLPLKEVRSKLAKRLAELNYE